MNVLITTVLMATCLSGFGVRMPLAGAPTEPTYANVSYGNDPANVLDFWQADGDGPRPLLVYIHGGGWVGGSKERRPHQVDPWLNLGISYASVHYRLTDQASLPAPVHDAARALQFLRTRADEWNFDKQRIALTGGSAGACTSMWLLLHADLADPDASDPVLRESTRVLGAAVAGGQTSIDPPVILEWLGPNVLKHKMIYKAVGEDSMESVWQDYDRYRDLYFEFSPINHLDAEDPPLWMSYGNNMNLPSEDENHGIHHPVFGVKMKEKADRSGHPCQLLIPGVSNPDRDANSQAFLTRLLLNGSPRESDHSRFP